MHRIAILAYHSIDSSGSVVSVSPQAFAAQIAAMAALGCRGISLREAVACRESTGGWPDRSVVVTFDDGYANVHELGLPILKQHGFSATVFVVSGRADGRNDWASPPAGLGTQRILNWRQISDLAEAGIEIGAHTRSHPDLWGLSEQEVEREIVGSRADIEKRLGQAVESFAYPFGGVDAPSLAIARRAFRAACTTRLKRAAGEPLHVLPRVDMFYIRTARDFRRLLEGELDGYLSIRRWGRSIRSILCRGRNRADRGYPGPRGSGSRLERSQAACGEELSK